VRRCTLTSDADLTGETAIVTGAAGIVAMSGIEVEIVPGERLPDDVLEAAQAALVDIVIAPDDVADTVL
jgi:hypothetical protein